jgi:hypothetical protein
MSDGLRIVYRPRGDATAEGELRTLAKVYAFLARKHQERKKGARPGAPDDAEDLEDDRTARKNYTR